MLDDFLGWNSQQQLRYGEAEVGVNSIAKETDSNAWTDDSLVAESTTHDGGKRRWTNERNAGGESRVGIDIDEFSVENARENFSLNNINNVSVILGDASAIEGEFQTIVANIHKNILTADLPTYVQHLAPQGTLILSGFFTDDVQEMTTVAEQNGLTVSQTLQRNNWAVLVLKK